jgi:cytochrome c biogenesis protein
MKRFFVLNIIVGIIILCVLLFGSIKNDEGFYRSNLFLLLLTIAGGLAFTCLLLKKKFSLDYWLTHLGFLVILSGALVSFLSTYRQALDIKEDEKIALPKTNLTIKLDDFNLKFYADGQTPKEFKSTLSLFEDDRLIKKGESLVNHPFSYKGFKFYQKSYGVGEVSFKVVSKGSEFIFKDIGDEVIEGKTGLKLKLLNFLPDFIIEKGKAFSKSENFNNPAINMAVYEGDNLKDNGWLFLKYKDFHHNQSRFLDELRFEDIIEERYFSSLEVVKDYGAKIVLVGSILMLLGLTRRFYFAH